MFDRLADAVLGRMARAGDAEAARELERRGVAPAVDLTALDYAALRRLVIAFREGTTPEARARSFEQAQRAQVELEVRWHVAQKHGTWELYPHDQAPPVPPWAVPRPPRCISWVRPQGSKLYPSEQDRTRAAIAALARGIYGK